MTFCDIYRINNNICEFSLNGKYVAMALQNNIIVRDAKCGEVVHSLSTLDMIEYIEWSPDSEFILCVMFQRAMVQVFSIHSPSWKCIIREGDAGISKVCWSPDSRHVVTIAQFNVWVCIWSLVGLSVLYIHNLKTSADPALEFSRDGNWLAVVECREEEDCISIFSATSWQLTKQCPCDRVHSVAGISWSPDSSTICVWDHRADHCSVQLVSAVANMPAAAYTEPSLGIKTMAWSPSGQFLALGCYDGKVHLLNHISWRLVMMLCHTNVLSTPACSVFKETIVRTQPDVDQEDTTTQTIFEPVFHRPIAISVIQSDPDELQENRGVGLVCFSPCGQLLVTRDDSMPATLWIWDVKSGRIHTFIAHARPVVDAKWDPGSLRLASVTRTTNICLWTPTSGASSIKMPRSSVCDLFVAVARWHPLRQILALIAGTRMTLMKFTGATDFS